jgi:hypothetical protein
LTSVIYGVYFLNFNQEGNIAMAKISDRTETFNGIRYRRKVTVDRNGNFCITLPQIDGMPRSVNSNTLKDAIAMERSALESFVSLNWQERKVIRIIYKGLKDNSKTCVISKYQLENFNGFGYSVQAAVLMERFAEGSDGTLYEYSIVESPLPGTVDYPLGRIKSRITGLIPHDEKVVVMLCDIIAKTSMLAKLLESLLDCDCVALKAAEYDPCNLLGQ